MHCSKWLQYAFHICRYRRSTRADRPPVLPTSAPIADHHTPMKMHRARRLSCLAGRAFQVLSIERAVLHPVMEEQQSDSSGPRASGALMIMSEPEARCPEDTIPRFGGSLSSFF